MSIAFDSTANSGVRIVSTRTTWEHTNKGDYLIVAVTASCEDERATPPVVAFDVVEVPRLGMMLNHDSDPPFNWAYVWLYGLANPPIGTYRVAVRANGMPLLADWAAGSVSYSGVKAVGQVATAKGLSNYPALAVPSESGEVVFAALSSEGQSKIIANAQTARWHLGPLDFFGWIGADQPGGPEAVASYMVSTTVQWALAALVLRP
jgi:hypothetical protein